MLGFIPAVNRTGQKLGIHESHVFAKSCNVSGIPCGVVWDSINTVKVFNVVRWGWKMVGEAAAGTWASGEGWPASRAPLVSLLLAASEMTEE